MTPIALLPGLALALVAATAPVATEEVRREVEAVYADGDYQRMPPSEAAAPPSADRPWWDPDETSKSSGGGNRGGGGPAGSGRRKAPPGSSSGLSGLVTFLAWSMLGGLLLLGIVWLAREWAPFWPGGPARKRRRQAAAGETTTVRVTPIVAEARPEHRVHADAGRFAEAIHALLLGSLWEIGKKRRTPFEVALTSREILPRSGLPEEAQGDLSGIVSTVEASRFGGVEVGRPNYEDCVERYDRVRGALGGGAA